MRCHIIKFTGLLLVLSILFSISAFASHYLDSSIIEVTSYLSRQDCTAEEILATRITGETPSKKLADTLRKEIINGNDEVGDVASIAMEVMALTASGTDPKNCGDLNLIDLLYVGSSPLLENKSPRDLAWALLALQSGNFTPSDEVTWSSEDIVDTLLSLQREDGGFGQSENAMSDAQSTAMVLTALAPVEGTQDAVEKGVDYLASAIQADGNFLSTAGDKTSEALSWTICALYSSGYTIQDERFIKNGNTLLDNLFTYQNEDNGFCSVIGEKSSVDAAFPALCALESVRSGAGLFNFSDVELSPYKTSFIRTYGTVLLMTVGIIAVIYLALLVTRRLAKRIDQKRTNLKKPSKVSDEETPKNE